MMAHIHTLTLQQVQQSLWSCLWWGVGLGNGKLHAPSFWSMYWCIYQYDGITMVNNPPHTTTFDPTNCKSLIGPHNQAQSSATSSSSAELSALSTISTIFSSVASFMHPDHALPLPSTPGPNPHNKLASPIANTSAPHHLQHSIQAGSISPVCGEELSSSHVWTQRGSMWVQGSCVFKVSSKGFSVSDEAIIGQKRQK